MKKEVNLPPLAKELVVEEVGAEILIYDNLSQRAFLPNAICGWVFRHCKAGTSWPEAIRLLSDEQDISPENARLLLAHALQKLSRAGLVELLPPQIDGFKTSRRKLLQAAGIGLALLPALATLLTPQPAQAASILCANLRQPNCANGRNCTGGRTCRNSGRRRCACA